MLREEKKNEEYKEEENEFRFRFQFSIPRGLLATRAGARWESSCWGGRGLESETTRTKSTNSSSPRITPNEVLCDQFFSVRVSIILCGPRPSLPRDPEVEKERRRTVEWKSNGFVV